LLVVELERRAGVVRISVVTGTSQSGCNYVR